MSEQFFSIEQTARFFQVSEATICSWLKRCELIATLRNRRLVVSAGEIARMLSIYPERQPMGLDSGVGRVVRLKRIITTENRGRVPAKEV
jgi:transposase